MGGANGRCLVSFLYLVHGADLELKSLRDCLLCRGRILVETVGLNQL